MSVLGSESERCRVLVMQLVYPSVERSVVKRLMRKVVPEIFQDEEQEDLKGHGLQFWEWDLICAHAEGDR